MVSIYYVEDDAAIASVVKEYLEGKGFQVTVCVTMERAREAIKHLVPGPYGAPCSYGRLSLRAG